MFCANCGIEIANETAKYCPKCGYKIEKKDKLDNPSESINHKEDKSSTCSDNNNSENEDIYIRAMELIESPEYKGSKVAKIRILRDEFGIGLVEAKSIIDNLENGTFNFENESKNSTNIENNDQKLNHNDNDDEYDKLLKNYISKEEEFTSYEYGIDLLIFIISIIYYMRNGEDFIVSVISALILTSIASFVIVSRIFKSIQKEEGCYRAKEKYDKFNLLKQSMGTNVAIHMVDLEFSNSNQEKHGLLYYLVCVVAVILIFAIC